jgi:hypothetical protein
MGDGAQAPTLKLTMPMSLTTHLVKSEIHAPAAVEKRP